MIIFDIQINTKTVVKLSILPCFVSCSQDLAAAPFAYTFSGGAVVRGQSALLRTRGSHIRIPWGRDSRMDVPNISLNIQSNLSFRSPGVVRSSPDPQVADSNPVGQDYLMDYLAYRQIYSHTCLELGRPNICLQKQVVFLHR